MKKDGYSIQSAREYAYFLQRYSNSFHRRISPSTLSSELHVQRILADFDRALVAGGRGEGEFVKPDRGNLSAAARAYVRFATARARNGPLKERVRSASIAAEVRKSSRYWVVKGNPRYYNWDKELRIGREENWHSRFPSAELALGDRIFLWESGGASRVIALGEVARPVFKKDHLGRKVFRIRYLTLRLNWMPELALLKANRILANASFLQSGVYRTVYDLSDQQGLELYRLLISRNSSDNIWRDVVHLPAPCDIDFSAIEGNRKLVAHLRRERNAALVWRKKCEFKRVHGKLYCEICNSEFTQYGEMSDALFEVHHRRPLGSAARAAPTRLSDLAVLCSNCHRVIHRLNPIPSIEVARCRMIFETTPIDEPKRSCR